ncbi:MAG: hypothetical protein JNN08_28390 [Bryobacterales bacterium]|nr:hypothetical protein [Bryobacterales bacterium]
MKTAVISMFAAMSLFAQQRPTLDIAANGGRQIELPQGWPLLVQGLLRPPPDTAGSFLLAPPGTAWFDAIQFRVSSPAGEVAGWNLKLTAVREGAELTLAANQFAMLGWYLNAESTSNLPAGVFQLTAVLEVKEGPGWQGSIRSVPVEIKVIPVPEALSPQQEVERARLRMQAALVEGQMEEAERIIDALLEAQPSSVYGLQAKAMLLERQGLTSIALAFASCALAEFRKQNPQAPEPPSGLHHLVTRLRKAAETQEGTP